MTSNTDPPLNFEQALMELQEIVRQLEEGAQGLEDSLRQFERGIGLYRRCAEFLKNAEQRIEILTGTDADGTPQTAPFDATATYDETDKPVGKRRATERPPEAEADETGERSLF